MQKTLAVSGCFLALSFSQNYVQRRQQETDHLEALVDDLGYILLCINNILGALYNRETTVPCCMWDLSFSLASPVVDEPMP